MNTKIKRICGECGKGFMIFASVARKSNSGQYCSTTCKRIGCGKKMQGVRKKENNIISNRAFCEMTINTKHGTFVVLFDVDDFDRIDKYKWGVGSHGYAYTHYKSGIMLMHRFIMDTPEKMDTDHVNHNRLDNRKNNLRVCTTSQNIANILIKPSKKYKGVHKSRNNTYYAKTGGIHLGTFETELLAAMAYNDAAKERYGDFAHLNSI